MKTKIMLLFFLVQLCLILPAIASEYAPLTFEFGIFDEQGFFSNYFGLSAGADIRVSNLTFGFNQKIYHGFSYGEWCGQTNVRIYFYDTIFFNLGASYLIKESSIRSSTDFGNNPLPVIGFGFNIPAKNPHFVLSPFLQMNQSYYLTDSIRPIYTDLTFPIAMTIGCSLNYRFRAY